MISARNEQALFLDAGTHRTFAVATRPEKPTGTGLVLLAGAGIAGVGNARVWVLLARELAARGQWVVRVDHRGAGESTGDAGELDLTAPFRADALAALRWLAPRAAAGAALVGECFGARTALACLDAPAPVRGLVLLFPPVTVAAPGTPRAAVESGDLVDRLDRAVAAGTPVVAVYGRDDVDRPGFERLAARFPGGRLTVAVEPGKLHGIASIAARDAVRRRVVHALHQFGME